MSRVIKLNFTDAKSFMLPEEKAKGDYFKTLFQCDDKEVDIPIDQEQFTNAILPVLCGDSYISILRKQRKEAIAKAYHLMHYFTLIPKAAPVRTSVETIHQNMHGKVDVDTINLYGFDAFEKWFINNNMITGPLAVSQVMEEKFKLPNGIHLMSYIPLVEEILISSRIYNTIKFFLHPRNSFKDIKAPSIRSIEYEVTTDNYFLMAAMGFGHEITDIKSTKKKNKEMFKEITDYISNKHEISQLLQKEITKAAINTPDIDWSSIIRLRKFREKPFVKTIKVTPDKPLLGDNCIDVKFKVHSVGFRQLGEICFKYNDHEYRLTNYIDGPIPYIVCGKYSDFRHIGIFSRRLLYKIEDLKNMDKYVYDVINDLIDNGFELVLTDSSI